jgi:hypothetical protein
MTDDVATWRQITGLNVTAVRRLPTDQAAIGVTVDGVAVQPSDRIELQIDGEWSPAAENGVYTVTTGESDD